MFALSKKFAFTLLTGALFIASPAMAQQKTKAYYPKGFRVGFGINGGVPTDSKYDAALGVDARLQYDVSKKTSFTLTSGYTHLFDGDNGDLGLVPIKAGFKQFLSKNIYAMGELGAAIGTHKEMGNSFLWSPSIGFANKFIDVSLRYENYNDYNTDQIGVRVAYGFSLKNYKKHNEKAKNKYKKKHKKNK
ncbi:hypothetical protein VSP20_06450 [Myroides phaeus]|uniref:hypothetical protein n=1 Tax=Myroides phaeus TaxID=702745 RepID=UPI002DB86581|nr:hypothetical protein [Myroides phaeus]MEC4116607.1 hypothetical protein [Myroides phaeus]